MIRKHRGLAQIEVIVMICVVSLLLVGAMPRLQAARQTARGVQCRNNLKQLGLALHNYHDIYNCFAPGWNSRRPDGVGYPSTGWGTSILPLIDEAPLYNQLEMRQPVYATRDQELLKKSIPAYQCPIGAVKDTNSLRGGWGALTYAGNYGPTPILRWTSTLSDESFWPGSPASPHQLESRMPVRGVFWINSKVGLRDITDGSSNTFLLGEKSVLSGGAIWPGPRSNFHEPDVLADTSHASPMNGSDSGFSSRHEGYVNFLMADGRVLEIDADIESHSYQQASEMGVYQKLGGINDGQRVNF